MQVLSIEDVLVFLEELRLDPARRHFLNAGIELLREAGNRGLLEWGDFAEITARLVELRRDGLADWQSGGNDSWGDDIINAREIRLTAEGRREARAVAASPSRLSVQGCEELLEDAGWHAALAELREGDAQFSQGHWADATADYYRAVESGLKCALDEAGSTYGNAALKQLARQATALNLLPANYQALFGFLDSIRSPRQHGRGASPETVVVGAEEALLMANHTRSLLLYLGQRRAASGQSS